MAKSKKPKKKKPYEEQIDADGNWLDEKRLFIGAIRRLFRQNPHFAYVSNESRKEVDKFNKDGSKSKKPSVLKQCEVCEGWFGSSNIAIDHKDPMTPLHLTNEEMSYDELRQNIMCHKKNLQRICNPKKGKKPGFLEFCHQKKSHEENFLRKKYAAEFSRNNITDRKNKEEFVKKEGKRLIALWLVEYTDYLAKQLQEIENKAKRKAEREAKKKKK